MQTPRVVGTPKVLRRSQSVNLLSGRKRAPKGTWATEPTTGPGVVNTVAHPLCVSTDVRTEPLVNSQSLRVSHEPYNLLSFGLLGPSTGESLSPFLCGPPPSSLQVVGGDAPHLRLFPLRTPHTSPTTEPLETLPELVSSPC